MYILHCYGRELELGCWVVLPVSATIPERRSKAKEKPNTPKSTGRERIDDMIRSTPPVSLSGTTEPASPKTKAGIAIKGIMNTGG